MQVYMYSQLKQKFMLNTNKHEDVFSFSLQDPLHSYWLIVPATLPPLPPLQKKQPIRHVAFLA